MNRFRRMGGWTGALVSFLFCLFVCSCSDKDDTYDAYYDWAYRNKVWYEQVADSARTAIREAQLAYGAEWESHCRWRMYQSTTLQPDQKGPVTDSICLKYISDPSATAGADRPLWSDTVRVHYRGWLMPVTERINGRDTLMSSVFDQSYYGEYSNTTAYPQQMLLSGTVPGYATALQYMHKGDDVMLYIPQELGYGGEEKSTIRAYSTLRFHLVLVEFFHTDEAVTPWI